VKTLGAASFYACWALANSPLPLDSQIVRIDEDVFGECESLTSFIFPSSLEYVGECCFLACNSLSNAIFSSPSHLRELLDVPAQISGVISIPDCVEILSCHETPKPPNARVLDFGRESKLGQIRPGEFGRAKRTFLQVSSRSLKLLRINLEFTI
jgi:hypothetical protein